MADVTLGPTSNTWSVSSVVSESRLTSVLAAGRGTLVAPSNGTCSRMQVYNATGAAYANSVGVYNAAGELLTLASFSVAATAGWYDVEVPSFAIAIGATYFSAIALNASTFPYAEATGSARQAIAGATSLPATWTGYTTVVNFEVGVRLVYDDSVVGSGNPAYAYAQQ